MMELYGSDEILHFPREIVGNVPCDNVMYIIIVKLNVKYRILLHMGVQCGLSVLHSVVSQQSDYIVVIYHLFFPLFTVCGGGVLPRPGTIAIPVVPFRCRSVYPTKLSITPSKLSFSPTASSFLASQYVKFSLAWEFMTFSVSICSSNSSAVIFCKASTDTEALCRAETGSNGGAFGGGLPDNVGEGESGFVLGSTSFFFLPDSGSISSRLTGMPRETRNNRRIRERFQSGGINGTGAAS